MVRTNRTAIVDSWFWFARFDPSDPHHEQARANADYLDSFQVLCPWPTMYETFNSRFVENPRKVEEYQDFMLKHHVVLLDDRDYRDMALDQTIEEARIRRRNISLVDMVIRFILYDTSIRTNYLITLDVSHFADVCRNRQIQILGAEDWSLGGL